MTILRWFLSKTVREAVNLKRHVIKLYRHQQDILSGEAVGELQSAVSDFGASISQGLPAKELRVEMVKFERAANKSRLSNGSTHNFLHLICLPFHSKRQ